MSVRRDQKNLEEEVTVVGYAIQKENNFVGR